MKPKFHYISVGLISIWLIVFGLSSFVLMVVLSFLEHESVHVVAWKFTLQNYRDLCNPVFVEIFLKSFYISFIVTMICLVLGYPFAYFLARLPRCYRNAGLLCLLLPFWTSSVVRNYAMVTLLKTKGALNTTLLALGIIEKPLSILFTELAVTIGLVYTLLPFMILPIYVNLERFDFSLIEAARDLGASGMRVVSKILLPLSFSGILGGSVLVFLPAMTLFYISDLLGGAKTVLLGNLIEKQFLTENNWPRGAATNVILTVLLAIGLIVYWLKLEKRDKNDPLV